MKKTKMLAVAGVCALLASCGSDNYDVKPDQLTTEIDSVSYALGINAGTSFANSLKTFPGEVNKSNLIAGFIEGLTADSADVAMDSEEAVEILNVFFDKEQKKELEKLHAEQDAYLDSIKSLEGVKELKVNTPAGEHTMYYKVITEGTGAKPTREDMVKVNYEGRLRDGSVFDSSYERNEPAIFAIRGVVPGFAEGVMQMSVGSKYQLIIPSELGYGDGGRPLPPASTLTFDVELLEINPKMPDAPARPGRR